jgi:protein-L-isoaspartate(D-aspartate) O-methyltransferase
MPSIRRAEAGPFSNRSCLHGMHPADWAPVDETTSALRKEMVDRLIEAGTIKTPSVEKAMGQIPRHLFVPQINAQAAYLDQAVMVKRAKDGSPISSASQPTIVAIMLEQLQVSPGHRVLEVGTGSGYNAALLGALCGPSGSVVSIELEPELAERAAQVLAHLGLDQVQVVIGDGRDGYSPQEPYDRVIVTAGARETATPWSKQLLAGGRLVVPLVDRNRVGSIVMFENIGGELRRHAESPCRFVPIRDTPV